MHFLRNNYRLLATAVLVVGSFIALWVTGVPPAAVAAAAYWPVIFVVQLFVLTTPWRAVSLGLTVQLFLVGLGVVPALTFLAQAGLKYVVGLPAIEAFFSSLGLGRVSLVTTVVAPVSEELLKPLPVIVLLLWGRRASWRRILGPLDAGILGAAAGAGFAVLENLGKAAGGFLRWLGPDRMYPSASPSVGPFVLYPDMVGSRFYGDPMVWFGHGELAAVTCLAFGLGLYLRKKTRLWFVLPGATCLLAIFEHFEWNAGHNTISAAHPLIRALAVLDFHGRLLAVVFTVGLAIALYIATVTLRWYTSRDTLLQLDAEFARSYFASLTADISQLPSRVISFFRFLRQRQAVAYGMRDFLQHDKEKAVRWAAWLHILRDMALFEKENMTDQELRPTDHNST